MIKECQVILNNDRFTVVDYCGVKVQFPAIHREANSLYVEFSDKHYKIVEKPKREKRKYVEEESIVVSQEIEREMTSAN